jgi:serine/threonine protein kinase
MSLNEAKRPAKGFDVDNANQDLLVAVLAIITDAVPRPALAEVLKIWSGGKGQSLAEWLRHSAGVDDQRIRAIECLASAHLESHQNDLRRSLVAWNALDLTQGVLTEIQDDGVRATLGALVGGDETIALNGSAPPSVGRSFSNIPPMSVDGKRFRLIRPHAQGGIGQVWVARDSELQRDVALKEIQPCYAECEDQRARFMLEAEITGNLEHPGIVPVYSLGRNADGRPYYAMRFIRGESFLAAIRRFHQGRRDQDKGVQSQTRPLLGIEFRQLLRRFLDVCDAMDYAHSRGVLHRDLKPANVMLGRYGETLVVDWGLAKVIDKTDNMAACGDGEFETSFAGVTVTTFGDTQPGTTIGTPAYMSPEQARGDIELLGATSDVYSLGVTLYELLTGEVPYAGQQISEVVEQVLKGDFKRPRTIDAAIPASLEAICLKAMAAEPARRYASVGELAHDLEHWLADEPVAAYPERRLERLGRWLRQHRAWTQAAVAALVGIAMAAIIAAAVVERLRRGEAEARQEAESNFKMAQSAVDDYLTSVSENTLLKQQDSVDIRTLRQELLKNALTYYKNFVTQRNNDPALRQQLANAYFRAGEITQEIDSRVEAIEAFHSAQAIWEQLAAANPANDRFREKLADCHLAIGKQKGAIGDLQGALTSFNQAREILNPLAARHPNLAPYQSSLADCFSEIGIIQGKLQSGDQGLDSLEKASAIEHGLIDRYPAEIRYRKRLAEIINVLGFVYYKRLDYADAYRCFEEVLQICQSLLDQVTAGPKPVNVLSLLALAHYNIAAIHLAQRQYDTALRSLEKSLKYRSELVAAHPSVTKFRENLGETYEVIADIQHKAHQHDKALSSLQTSIGILEKLAESHPEQARHHGSLGRSWNALGYLHDELRHNLEAIPAFEKAVNEQELAIARSPDDSDYKILRSNHLENLGEQYIDLGQVERGLPYYKQAIEIRQQLCAAYPEKREYLFDFTDALSMLGHIQRHGGDSVAAAESFATARAALERVVTVDATLRGRLGAILTALAAALEDQKKTGDALILLRRAVETLSHLDQDLVADDKARERKSEALWELARVLRAAGEPGQAEESDVKRKGLWKNQPPAKLAALALRETTQAVLIGYGKSPIDDRARSVRELDLDQAAASLRLAISLGFNDLPMLKQNPDSWALLARADLQTLIKYMESTHSDGTLQPQKQQ